MEKPYLSVLIALVLLWLLCGTAFLCVLDSILEDDTWEGVRYFMQEIVQHLQRNQTVEISLQIEFGSWYLRKENQPSLLCLSPLGL